VLDMTGAHRDLRFSRSIFRDCPAAKGRPRQMRRRGRRYSPPCRTTSGSSSRGRKQAIDILVIDAGEQGFQRRTKPAPFNFSAVLLPHGNRHSVARGVTLSDRQQFTSPGCQVRPAPPDRSDTGPTEPGVRPAKVDESGSCPPIVTVGWGAHPGPGFGAKGEAAPPGDSLDRLRPFPPRVQFEFAPPARAGDVGRE